VADERPSSLARMSGALDDDLPSVRPDPHARRRHVVVLVLRIGLSAVMLAILFGRIDFDSVMDRERDLRHLTYLGLGVVAMFGSYLVAAWRWHRTAEVLELDLDYGDLVGPYLAGQFVGNFLPSTIGGDVLRVQRVGRRTAERERAFASVVLERLTGFVVLPMLILVGIALRPSWLDHGAGTFALLLALGGIVVLGGLLVLGGSEAVAGRYVHAESWTRFIGAIHTGLDSLRAHRDRLNGVVIAATCYQLCVVVAVWCATKAVDIELPLVALLVVAPAVSIVQLLPVGLGGLGVREGAFVLFLRVFDIDSADAVAVGLIVYAQTLTSSLTGAPSFALGARQPVRARAPQAP
jgi:glycosyltransferase 2 family protein